MRWWALRPVVVAGRAALPPAERRAINGVATVLLKPLDALPRTLSVR